jgi:2,3-bisphosphoglycerate-dependent phosphoglycerate mutase
VPLSELGVTEAKEAGRLMKAAGLAPAVVHTSVLVRAIQTADLALAEMDRTWVPVRRSWRLNERHYGALQGLNKKETSERFGEDKVKVWRRSYDVRPPALETKDERHPSHDPRYAGLPPELLPSAECLKDVVERMLPYWYDSIVPDLSREKCVLVSAHGNSLRALPGSTSSTSTSRPGRAGISATPRKTSAARPRSATRPLALARLIS